MEGSSRFVAPPIFIKSAELANNNIFMYEQSPSHQGWLIIWCVHERRRWKMGDCCLWNPTTFESIMLPSLFSFLDDETITGPFSAILTSPPTSNNSMVVFSFCNRVRQDLCFLLFCCPGDKQWRKQDYSLLAPCLFCFRGSSTKLCIMGTDDDFDKIHMIEKLEPQISINSLKVLFNNNARHPAEGESTIGIKTNYVECCDELFKIVRAYRFRDYFSGKALLYFIKISKFDFASKGVPSWVKVESMGNHVLFLGENSIASSSAAELGLTKGCVYFTQRNESVYKFDVEDDSIYVCLPYSSLDQLMPLSPQDWVRLVHGRSGDIFCDEEGAQKTLPAEVDYAIVQPTSPHLVFLQKNVWNFIDPMHNNHKYHLNSLSEILLDATIHFSKGGWLLMSRGKRNVFFFNPFTRVTICLPDLEKYYMFSGVSFSSLPTSSDCVVFGIAEKNREPAFISISRGDDSWVYNTELPSRENLKEFKVSLNNPVFFKGVFYCIDQYGTLGVFEKQHTVCKWEVLDKPERPSINGDIYMSFLVECQGELLSVLLGHLGKHVSVFRLDFSNMNWVEVDSLQKHMLFISGTSSILAIAPNSMMENKIFFARLGHGNKIIYYCLDTSRYYCFGSQHSAEDFYGTKRQLNCSWIEPNWADNTPQELDWKVI